MAQEYVDQLRVFLGEVKPKLPDDDREQPFRSKQAKKLRHFPKAPIKKQYSPFPKSILIDHSSAKTWIEKSLKFVVGESG